MFDIIVQYFPVLDIVRNFFYDGISLLKEIPDMVVTYVSALLVMPSIFVSAGVFCITVRIITLIMHRNPGGD